MGIDTCHHLSVSTDGRSVSPSLTNSCFCWRLMLTLKYWHNKRRWKGFLSVPRTSLHPKSKDEGQEEEQKQYMNLYIYIFFLCEMIQTVYKWTQLWNVTLSVPSANCLHGITWWHKHVNHMLHGCPHKDGLWLSKHVTWGTTKHVKQTWDTCPSMFLWRCRHYIILNKICIGVDDVQ